MYQPENILIFHETSICSQNKYLYTHHMLNMLTRTKTTEKLQMPSYWQTCTIIVIGCNFPDVFQLPSHSIQVWLALDITKTRDDKTADTMTTDMNPWFVSSHKTSRQLDAKDQTERIECIKWHDDFYHCCCSWLMTLIVYSTLGSCTSCALVMKGSDLL